MPKKEIPFPDISDTAAAMECTGLMPTPPRNAYEYASYQSLYAMALPREEAVPNAYGPLDNDLGRDNLENDLPAADREDL